MKKVFLIILSTFIFTFNIPLVKADPLDHWTWRASYPLDEMLQGVAYGNNTFVAVDKKGTIRTSSDSIVWKEVNSGTDIDLWDALFVKVVVA